MYPISSTFKDYLRLNREWLVKVEIAGKTYPQNAVVDFTVENNMALDGEFYLGDATYSKTTLRLRTTDVVPPNARVVPSVALQLPDGAQTEWLPLGEFFIDSRSQLQMKDVWEFVCYDKLVFADVPYISQLTYPTSMKAVWDEICTRLGFDYDSTVVINPTYQIQAGPAGFTCRQVLGYIAAANGANLYISKDGILRFSHFSAADQPVMELTAKDYIRVKQTNPVKTYTRIVVVYDTEDGLFYEAGSGDENHTLYVDLPFATQAITNDLFAKLNGFSYVPIEMVARGYPQIELGDRFRFGWAVESPTWETADITWQDADFTWDGFDGSGGISLTLNQTYSFRGGLKMTIDAPSKSEQRSEFEIDGTLSGQINRLNQNAVKLGKAYYGATLTRKDGFIVEREDHLSKVTLNSDKMEWQVNGESALYFDALEKKLKYKGDIIMEGGTISWSSVNMPTPGDIGALPADSPLLTEITPTGIYTGTIKANQIDVSGGKITADQIDATHLRVDSANIDGTITANAVAAGATITSPTIIGGVYKTAESGRRIEITSGSLRMYDPFGAIDGPVITEGSGIGGSYYAGALLMYYRGTSKMYIAGTPDSAEITGFQKLVLTGVGGLHFGNRGISNYQRGYIDVDELHFNLTTSTSATSGSATLPANPQGFLHVHINGVARKIPYYT